MRPALSSHSEIQDTTVPAAADVPLGAPAFAFTTAAGRWQPDTAKDSGDAHATLLEEHLFVLAANRQRVEGLGRHQRAARRQGQQRLARRARGQGRRGHAHGRGFLPGRRHLDGACAHRRWTGVPPPRREPSPRSPVKGWPRRWSARPSRWTWATCTSSAPPSSPAPFPRRRSASSLMLDLDPKNGVRDLLQVAGFNEPNADVNVLGRPRRPHRRLLGARLSLAAARGADWPATPRWRATLDWAWRGFAARAASASVLPVRWSDPTDDAGPRRVQATVALNCGELGGLEGAADYVVEVRLGALVPQGQRRDQAVPGRRPRGVAPPGRAR